MEFFTTIGIEIHAELLTKGKMFSSGRVDFEASPNSCVSIVDLAFPGTLPSINKAAVIAALKVCYGLNMEIDSLLRFDRKNYFYSDLPKGFQITQQFYPIGKNGVIKLMDHDPVRIHRLHLEEDTAKQLHEGDKTRIDFNRAGVPLIEIVSEPDIHSASQAVDYVSNLRQLLLYLGVCDGKMEEGSLRCDVNISLSKDPNVFGRKVEIKNLNSLNNIEKAIAYEIKRQSELIEKGIEIDQETRRFDEKTQTTISLRKKEGSVDYRYFPEPNIVPIQLQESDLNWVSSHLPELPMDRLERYKSMINEVDAKILVANKEMGDYFDRVIESSNHFQACANFVISQVAPLGFASINAYKISQLVNYLQDGKLSSKQGKQLLGLLVDSSLSVDELIEKHNLVQVSDDGLILSYIDSILTEFPNVIVDFKNGKDNSIKFVMGQIMKLSKGQVNPAMAMTLVKKVLSEK